MENKLRFENNSMVRSSMLAMKKTNLLVFLAIFALVLSACGGGSSGGTGPELPPPGTESDGGDLNTTRILGEPPTPFAPMGGQPFTDIRGIAMSSRFIYIADATTISLYRPNGMGLTRVAAPYGATIQGIAVIPEELNVILPENFDLLSPFAGLPVVLHNPVPTQGYVTLLPPNLDTDSTIEDIENVDITRLVTFPNAGDEISPPLEPPTDSSPPWICNEVVDIKVDPFGSFLVTSKLLEITPEGLRDEHGHLNDPPRWHVGLQVFNRFNNYALEPGGGWRTFHKAQGWEHAIGYLGDIAVSNFVLTIPSSELSEYEYLVYTGDVFAEGDLFLTGGGNFIDFVGRTRMRLNLAAQPTAYELNPLGVEPPFYDQIFGVMFGERFSPWPNGDDPDLTNGGPSGMFVDPKDGSLYICDPGNDRILVYDGFEVDPMLPTLIGDTQELIKILGPADALEPSEVMVDRFGRTFIVDHNDLRILPGQPTNTVYGSIGGTVRHLELGIPLVGAIVTLSDEFSTFRITTNINGDYLFPNAPYGQYMVTGSMAGFQNDSFVATIVPDETIRVDFNLPANEPILLGEYIGTVYDDSTRSFLAGVTVSLVGLSHTAITDLSGQFKIPNLAAGTYQAIFTKDGYENTTQDVVITRGSTTEHPSIILTRIPLS